MGVEVVVAPSVRHVLDDVAARLDVPLDDPFTPDIVVVPTPGVRDWLIEGLALRRDGTAGSEAIVANVEFQFPNQFNLWATGLGREQDSVWAPANLQWHVLRLLAEDPSAAPGFDPATGALAYARRVAELFDRYGAQRVAISVWFTPAPKWASTAFLRPKSPGDQISSRPIAKIKNISAVHGPIPLRAVRWVVTSWGSISARAKGSRTPCSNASATPTM